MTAARVLLLEAAGPESAAVVAAAVATGVEVYVATHRDIHDSYDEKLRASLAGCLVTAFTGGPPHALLPVDQAARSPSTSRISS